MGKPFPTAVVAFTGDVRVSEPEWEEEGKELQPWKKKLTPELQQTASTSLIRFSQVLSAFSLMMSSLCVAISSFPLTSHPR